MDINTSDFLALRHYSRSKPVTCTLISGTHENFFTVRLDDDPSVHTDILKGDPVTFGKLNTNKETELFGGFVLSKADCDEITISPDMTSFDVEKRHSKRHPVSIFGQIKHGSDMDNVVSAWIKDISYEGLRIFTESQLEIDDSIEVNLCAFNGVFNIEGIIIRKRSLYGRNEYGIQMTFRYKSTVFNVREYIDNLIAQERKLIESHFAHILP